MATNFDLAPPRTIVDGLAAVPIDIQHITASLTFDGTTSSGTGDATLDFIVGPGGGCPIFDLRQAITSLWLDGAPFPPAQAALRDFGGGTGAELRVIEAVLAAGSSHTLRVTYTLGPPQASTAGSYQPGMAWSAGPRLAFNFGFTDLGPGRYLEAWVPANLIFDQFDLTLELRIVNTPVAHSVISNGTATTIGTNHWSVVFPARSTALSPLVEVRATDTLASQTGSVTLPVSGQTVTIEAWKLATSSVDLAARVADIAAWLSANETSTGRYVHGSRFLAFLHTGGMEYDGGTTTGVGALRHEVFHSWWGRGLKPASQADGWWDEAWTVYNDLGASGSAPFDFTAAPVTLSSTNPWVRATPSSSYSSGERVFRGAAALTGASQLRTHMAAFFTERHGRPATTPQLEEHLVSRSGEATLVDAFHRFVYGFPDPSPAPDLWIKDNPGHTGSHLTSGTFWNSPDLWIRHADDGGTTHQPAEFGQDNWFHARVRNRSASAVARHFLVTFNVKPWAGTEFVYPGDFLPSVAAAAGFELGPGEERIVRARWPRALVPPAGTHVCWLAAVLARLEKPGSGLHVWEHNNLAQKNLTVVDLLPNEWFILPFLIDRFLLRLRRPRRLMLQLRRPPKWTKIEAALLHRSPDVFAGKVRAMPEVLEAAARVTPQGKGPPGLDCGAGGLAQPLVPAFEPQAGLRFGSGRAAAVPLALPGTGQRVMGLAIRMPAEVAAGDEIPLDLVQWDEQGKRVTGGLAVVLRARRGRPQRMPVRSRG
jgi:hypothetical protein